MPRGTGRIIFDDFLGGLNEDDDRIDLPVNQAIDFTDLAPYGEGGAVQVRKGDSAIVDASADSTVSSVVRPLQKFHWLPISGNVRLIALTGSGKVLSYLSTSPTTLYSPVTPYAASAADAAFVVAPASGGQGPLYFRATSGTGVDVVQQSSGLAAAATWTASAGTIPVKLIYLYTGNRVWAFGPAPNTAFSAATDAQVVFSELGDPRNWPAANTFQLDPGDGFQFTAGGLAGNNLVIFKPDKAWVVYDLNTGANRRLQADVGALSQETTVTTPRGLFFIDPQRGPMLTNGTTVEPLENGHRVLKAVLAARAVAYADDSIYVMTGANNMTYEYNMRLKSWWQHNYFANWLAPLATSADTSSVLYAARAGAGQAHWDLFKNGGSIRVDGFPLIGLWKSPYLGLGAPFERKRIHRVEITGAGVVGFRVNPDPTLSATIAYVGDLGSGGQVVFPTPGVARLPSFEVYKASGTVFRLDQVVVDYSTRHK